MKNGRLLLAQDVGIPHKKKECTNIKQLFITEAEQALLLIPDNAQQKTLHEYLAHVFLKKENHRCRLRR